MPDIDEPVLLIVGSKARFFDFDSVGQMFCLGFVLMGLMHIMAHKVVLEVELESFFRSVAFFNDVPH